MVNRGGSQTVWETPGGGSEDESVCASAVSDMTDISLFWLFCASALPVVKYSYYQLPRGSYGHSSGQGRKGEHPAGGFPGPASALSLSSFQIAFLILLAMQLSAYINTKRVILYFIRLKGRRGRHCFVPINSVISKWKCMSYRMKSNK